MGKAINVSLTYDKSSSGNQRDTSNSDEFLNYMTFAFVVKSEKYEKYEKVDDLE